MPKGKTVIDSAMSSLPHHVKSYTETPGQYGEGPIGPKGVDGGVPLKMYDTSIKGPETKPISPPLTATTAKTSKG